jgi:raffinose/stachyose/melibiose transport system permease protein
MGHTQYEAVLQSNGEVKPVKPKIHGERIFAYLFLVALVLVMTVPLLTVIFTAFKTDLEMWISSSWQPPKIWQVQNFINAWTTGRFELYFFNTVFVTVVVTVLGIFFGFLMTYAMVIIKVPFSPLWLGLFLLGLTIPEESLLIPLYTTMHNIGLQDTYWGIILPQVAMSIGFAVIYLRPCLIGLPSELLDAAQIDGCGHVSLLRHIAFPMAKPVMSALVVIFFLGTWNEFLIPLILATSDNIKTLPCGLFAFHNAHQSNLTLEAAGTVIITIPALIIYLIFQRSFIRGVTAGAVKG